MKAFFMMMIGFGVFYGIYYMITHFHTVLYWGLIGIGVIFALSLLAKAIEGIQTWYMKTFRSEEYDQRISDMIFAKHTYTPVHMHQLTDLFHREATAITYEEACDRIHKLPTEGDFTFVIGVTNDNGLHAILPKPKHGVTGRVANCPEDKFYTLPFRTNSKENPIPFHELDLDPYQTTYNMPTMIDHSEFVTFFDVSSSYTLNLLCTKLLEKPYYRFYITEIVIAYFDTRRKLLKELDEAVTADDYRRVCMALEELKTPNADMVSIMLPKITPTPKEILKKLGHDFDHDKNKEKSTMTLHKEGDENEWI